MSDEHDCMTSYVTNDGRCQICGKIVSAKLAAATCSRFVCRLCGADPSKQRAHLKRVNPLGEVPAIWECANSCENSQGQPAICSTCHHWEPKGDPTLANGYCPIFNKTTNESDGKRCTAWEKLRLEND